MRDCDRQQRALLTPPLVVQVMAVNSPERRYNHILYTWWVKYANNVLCYIASDISVGILNSAHPVRRRISVWGCGAVTLGVWLLSLALAAPPSLYTRYLDLRPSGIDLVICEEFWPDSGNLRLLYSCFILIASYMIPLLSVSISYCAITISLKRYSVPGEQSNSQQCWSQKRKKTFLLLVASVLAFALCWLPLQVSLFKITF